MIEHIAKKMLRDSGKVVKVKGVKVYPVTTDKQVTVKVTIKKVTGKG